MTALLRAFDDESILAPVQINAAESGILASIDLVSTGISLARDRHSAFSAIVGTEVKGLLASRANPQASLELDH